jgi:hypothetical protein
LIRPRRSRSASPRCARRARARGLGPWNSAGWLAHARWPRTHRGLGAASALRAI